MIILCRHQSHNKYTGQPVDCGHCLACRIKRRSSWVTRMEHEFVTQGAQALFVTLTYNDANCPKDGGLSKRHLQLFFKRLRRTMDYHCDKTKFRYYACGEYGDITRRPHYHFIIFGLTNKYRKLLFDTWGMCDPVGFKCKVVLNDDNKAFRYVAGYVNKKLGSGFNHAFYKENGIIPPFQLQSKGIGKDFFFRIGTPLFILKKGVETIPPRYYRKLAGFTAEHYAEPIRKLKSVIRDKVLSHFNLPRIFSTDMYSEAIYDSVYVKYFNKFREQCNTLLMAREFERSLI